MLIRTKAVRFLQRKGIEYIQGHNRHQSYFATLEEQVSSGNGVRLIDDAFTHRLDLQQLRF
jgi:hypothetical protein